MLYNIYAIYDTKSHQFQFPFFQKNDECATRQFALALKKVPFLDDLELYRLGQFEDDVEENYIPTNYTSMFAQKTSIFVTSGSSVAGYFKEDKNEVRN